MAIKVNVYLNPYNSDIHIDYDLKVVQHVPGYLLLLTEVNVDNAREFVDLAKNYFSDKQLHPTNYFFEAVCLYDREFNSKVKIKNIKLHESVFGFLVEKMAGMYITPGTRFFCGQCGSMVGEAIDMLTLPFLLSEFRARVAGELFTVGGTEIGTYIQCNCCDEYIMPLGQPGVIFVPLEEYFSIDKKKK